LASTALTPLPARIFRALSLPGIMGRVLSVSARSKVTNT